MYLANAFVYVPECAVSRPTTATLRCSREHPGSFCSLERNPWLLVWNVHRLQNGSPTVFDSMDTNSTTQPETHTERMRCLWNKFALAFRRCNEHVALHSNDMVACCCLHASPMRLTPRHMRSCTFQSPRILRLVASPRFQFMPTLKLHPAIHGLLKCT